MAAPKSDRDRTGKKGVALPKGPTRRKSVSEKLPRTKKKIKVPPELALKRYEHNPIIAPSSELPWESKATFNPSAIFGDGKVHLIYRAIGNTDVSVFGYARSKDGFTIDYKSSHPAYYQKAPVADKKTAILIPYSSGGGWNGGGEDPRLTLIDDRVYMLYTSFDGWNSIRIAMTSISFSDFVSERWNWNPHVFISPPGEVHKNWVLFPEKINGKYAILHGISPKIMVEYVADLEEFDGTKYIRSTTPTGGGYADSWDSWLRGVGPAPIKTKYGWLVLYHAMDVDDPNRYKIGAMLLDLSDPTNVLVRSQQPILEPDEHYENEGWKSGVVYACGAVATDDGFLFVYYGGADKVVCVAVAELEPFLKTLISSGSAKISRKGGRKQ